MIDRTLILYTYNKIKYWFIVLYFLLFLGVILTIEYPYFKYGQQLEQIEWTQKLIDMCEKLSKGPITDSSSTAIDIIENSIHYDLDRFLIVNEEKLQFINTNFQILTAYNDSLNLFDKTVLKNFKDRILYQIPMWIKEYQQTHQSRRDSLANIFEDSQTNRNIWLDKNHLEFKKDLNNKIKHYRESLNSDSFHDIIKNNVFVTSRDTSESLLFLKYNLSTIQNEVDKINTEKLFTLPYFNVPVRTRIASILLFYLLNILFLFVPIVFYYYEKIKQSETEYSNQIPSILNLLSIFPISFNKNVERSLVFIFLTLLPFLTIFYYGFYFVSYYELLLTIIIVFILRSTIYILADYTIAANKLRTYLFQKIKH